MGRVGQPNDVRLPDGSGSAIMLQAVRRRAKQIRTTRTHWEKPHPHFAHLIFNSITHLLGITLNDQAINLPAPSRASS